MICCISLEVISSFNLLLSQLSFQQEEEEEEKQTENSESDWRNSYLHILANRNGFISNPFDALSVEDSASSESEVRHQFNNASLFVAIYNCVCIHKRMHRTLA